mmetsp:Transcript_40774/g.103845  ORF Transcript_40774/g.103845 Transcript_40774/m.103845 type:complete len:85 (+) Transcript_40774:3-257(+)
MTTFFHECLRKASDFSKATTQAMTNCVIVKPAARLADKPTTEHADGALNQEQPLDKQEFSRAILSRAILGIRAVAHAMCIHVRN